MSSLRSDSKLCLAGECYTGKTVNFIHTKNNNNLSYQQSFYQELRIQLSVIIRHKRIGYNLNVMRHHG